MPPARLRMQHDNLLVAPPRARGSRSQMRPAKEFHPVRTRQRPLQDTNFGLFFGSRQWFSCNLFSTTGVARQSFKFRTLVLRVRARDPRPRFSSVISYQPV